jgi:ribonuclease-3
LSFLKRLQKRISYHFKDPQLLATSLTHRSYINQNEREREDNERLEFLGDSVIELVVSHILMIRFPHLKEGGLSKMRAVLVKEDTLASLARLVKLGASLMLGRGEEETGGREKDSILAGGIEALVAAVYLDGGYEEAFRVIERLYTPLLDEIKREAKDGDFKTRLQEYTQRLLNTTPQYILVREEGPDHDKTFDVIISIEGKIYGRGKGKNKKEAEQKAAAEALHSLEEN